MQEGHGVYDCCAICGEFIKFDGMADADGTYHRKCKARKFEVGENVNVIEDAEDPESGWVGCVCQVVAYRDHVVIVKAIPDFPYPDNSEWFVDGNSAWFSESELERYDDKGWDPVGS